jgi:perosamine synthetase
MSFDPNAVGANRLISLAEPEIRGREWEYVKQCLDTNWVSTVGSFVDRFEGEITAYTGCSHAVATTNGTAALHLALLAAGVRPDDEVVMPALTFIAPANAIRYVGAWPVFVDADPHYWQLDPEKLNDFFRIECYWANGELRNKSSGRRVAGVLPVHILGHPSDMDSIVDLAKGYDLAVVVDAAESLGAQYKGAHVGKHGDISCFSFNGNKVITTGGGGMVVTDNEEWAKRVMYLSTQAKDDPVEYVHNDVGYNYRLTNVQAAIGVAQMEQLDSYLEAKRRIALLYKEELEDVPGLSWAAVAEWANPTFWLSTVLVDRDRYGIESRTLMVQLQEANIQSRPLWSPIYKQNPFKGCMAYRIEVADRLCRDGLSLPSSVGLNSEDQMRVIKVIRQALISGG